MQRSQEQCLCVVLIVVTNSRYVQRDGETIVLYFMHDFYFLFCKIHRAFSDVCQPTLSKLPTPRSFVALIETLLCQFPYGAA